MKFKLFATIAALVMSFTGKDEIPVNGNQVAFPDEDAKKLKEALGDEDFQKMVDSFNSEIAGSTVVKNLSAEIKKLAADTNMSEQELTNLARGDTSAEDEDPNVNLAANLELLKTKMQEKNDMIQALINGAEDDIPLEKIKGNLMKEKFKHSSTHLFASGKSYDAFEGRNWNKRAAGLTTTATDFSEGSEIDKLNGDLTLFYRENPDQIDSLHRDFFGLPTDWDRQINVVDRIVSGSIVTAEITQARKLPWLPKNKQLIQPEEGKIYPVSIDAEFIGHLLSTIEASWISQYNKEGSQAYKMTFVRFLVAEIDKQARVEDRISTIKGVYVATPNDATVPGRYINRQNGLLYQYWKARDIDKKYRAFDLGLPTTANIVDYVDNMIKSLPLDVRRQQGLEFQLSPYWRDAYDRRYAQIYGLNQDFKGYLSNPKDFPNIKFQPLVDLEGHDFMAITWSKNVQILENIPSEKSMYHIEMMLRKIYVFADYKLGIRLKHIGTKVKDGDPDEFKVQTVWSNTAPIFQSDFYVPVFDNASGEVAVNFDRLQVAADWGTDITKFDTAGAKIIRIQGNTQMPATKYVKNNADIVIGSDFDLKSGGTLTLLVTAAGKVKQLSRTTAPPAVVEEQAVYSTATVDANLGSDFASEHTVTTAIAGIVNGTEGKEITLNGTDAVGVNVTLSTTGNISLASAATLDTAADNITLILVDGIWIETSRTIA